MNASHQLIPKIAAHRVVNRNGMLTGKIHFGGNAMQQSLEAEGITIVDDKIQNFSSHYWDPTIELAI
jgi:methylated-DNA-protein-cysteine methyltransferase-like protein